jgi:hypothetical protein
MSTFICLGYEGHPCQENVEQTTTRRRCPECTKEEEKIKRRNNYKRKHPQTIVCPGYEGHTCGAPTERRGSHQKWCRECAKEVKKARRAAWRESKKEELHKQSAVWYSANKENIRPRKLAYKASHKEDTSLRSHHNWIFGTKTKPPLKNYEGMPFCDAWNPDKGGSFLAGGQWIRDNLVKPLGRISLHVVDPLKGFVPGNLEWTHPVKQIREQMHKIIARQRHQINQQSEYIRSLENQINVLRKAEPQKAA